MSLTVDGVWKAGVWATTVWADGVWFEGSNARRTIYGGRVHDARRERARLEREIDEDDNEVFELFASELQRLIREQVR